MNAIMSKGLSRRSLLASAGAFGAASFAYPHIAVSQDGTILTVRSYSDLQLLDPAFRLSLPEEDIINSIFAPMVTVEHGQHGDKGLAFSRHHDLVEQGIA